MLRSDLRHSKGEKRYYALGQTSAGWRLSIAFTVRRKLILVISARDMKRNETETCDRYEEELPEFKSEDDERRFWATADSAPFAAWQSGKRTKLVQQTDLKTMSLRLPVSMIEDLKVLANRRDVPYQSLLKVFLAERLAREQKPRQE